ncbi:hypothetical protein Tco_0161680, partial [Tanacetum coccineum]
MPSFPSPEPTISHSYLDFFKDFENKFPAITYNDDLTSKLTKPSVSFQRIKEFDLNDETSLSEYDKEEPNVLYFNDSFPLNIVFPNNLKSDKDIDDDENRYMAPLPPRDQRHPWFRYQVEGFTEDIMHNYEQRLKTIFGRSVNRVHILDFIGLAEGMRQTLAGRLRMVYIGDEGQELISDTVMGLDVADTLCFQLGGASVLTGDISGRGQAPKKVTSVDLFYHRSTDRGTANVPYLLAQYLFRHTERRKSGARLFEGHFIERIATHFGLVSDQGLG